MLCLFDMHSMYSNMNTGYLQHLSVTIIKHSQRSNRLYYLYSFGGSEGRSFSTFDEAVEASRGRSDPMSGDTPFPPLPVALLGVMGEPGTGFRLI